MADFLMTPEEMVKYLIESDMEYILNGGNAELLYSYLDTGFLGYSNYSEAELIREVQERKEREAFES